LKYILNILLISVLGLGLCSAFAAEGPVRIAKPEDVVITLYRDFGWELTSDDSSKTVLILKPISVLRQFFTPKLVKLIVNDREYVARTKEIGHLDFILISGSQDPGGISNIRIARKPGTNVATVLYDQNGEKDVMRIDYYTVHTRSGWRISDVRYKTRKSTAFPVPEPELSLLMLLSQPY
jgi:hypothetical protein